MKKIGILVRIPPELIIVISLTLLDSIQRKINPKELKDSSYNTIIKELKSLKIKIEYLEKGEPSEEQTEGLQKLYEQTVNLNNSYSIAKLWARARVENPQRLELAEKIEVVYRALSDKTPQQAPPVKIIKVAKLPNSNETRLGLWVKGSDVNKLRKQFLKNIRERPPRKNIRYKRKTLTLRNGSSYRIQQWTEKKANKIRG